MFIFWSKSVYFLEQKIVKKKEKKKKGEKKNAPSAHINRNDTNESDEEVLEEIGEVAPQNEEINRNEFI